MHPLIRFIGLLLLLGWGAASAQSRLPACPASGYFHNCFGTYTFPSGNKYVGDFKDNNFNGQGTHTWANGDKYVGEWKDDKRNGQGNFTFATGRLTGIDPNYVGDWKDDERNGQGTFTEYGGYKYVGEWKAGKRDGQATYFRDDGSVVSVGIWADDKFVRSAPVQEPSNNLNTELARLRAEAEEAKRRQAQDEAKESIRVAQQLASQVRENERLRSEAAEAKRKQAEAEESIRVAQQLAEQVRENERLRAEAAEAKRKLDEAELRLAQQQASQTKQPLPVTAQSAAPISRRVALVVGNKNYKVRPLQNSLNDADDMSASLRTSGFDVIDIRDATLPQMRTAVRQFGDKLLTFDVGLVYYSGHGVEVKGRNYFIPVNADIQREDEIADQGLDVSLILEKMSTAGKGVNILIVDACRDDPFGRSFRSTSRGLAQMDAPRGTIIAYATSPGKVASDGDPSERNSPYTKNLVKAMQAPNKPIEQVFKEVRRAVQDETKNTQTPWENTSLSGDFFFNVHR